MNIVTRKLIAKELYINRWFIVGAAVSGVVSVIIATFGRVGFNVGSLMWITTVIALGVMLALYGVMNERKEHSLLFVLSLPLSVGDYVRAKLIGLVLCYFIPWVVASAAAVVLVLAKDGIPDGLLPYTVLLCVFMFANFSLVLCGALHATSEALIAATIVITNMLVSLYMFVIASVPGLGNHMQDPAPVWNTAIWTILAIELGVLALALTLPLLVAARRRDFI
jgi:ABC-2 type transport system permease protein